MRLATPAALAAMTGVLLAACSMANLDAPTTLRPMKVGTTISFLDLSGADQKSLAKRPIAQELAKENLELCYYPGPGKDDLTASLKPFNAVWLLLEHEAMNSYDPDVVGKALRAYVEQGGGLVINHSPGRYPEAPVDTYWDKVFKHLDMDRLHEEVVDLASREPLGKGNRSAFYTKAFTDHPVTRGVPGLWLLCRDSSAGCGSHAITYSDDWKIVVSGPKTAKSYLKDKNTNQIDYNKLGFYRQDAPLVAIRELGKGRIVSIAAHKDHSGWMWGCDRWPSELYRGELHGQPTDMVKLLENALRWAGEPSLAIPEFTKNYHPYEPTVPPYPSNDASGVKAVPRFDKIGGGPRKAGANGIIGLHSTYSDGRSSVAEYAAAAQKAGLNFIVFTDPLELMTPEKIDSLRADCRAVSDDPFYACPGVEHSDASGLRWALFHDRIAFPAKETVFDGVNTFQVFDGKVVLQRNGYDGHQNLYRGAIIDYSALDKAGADAVNLVYFNGVIPMAFEVDRPIADNRQAMLRTAANLHRYAPFSFTRVRSAEEVARAAKASRTQAATLADIRKTCNESGWGANDAATRGSQRVVLGDGIELERFACQAVQGTPLFQFAFAVSSLTGIKEVVIHDADQRVLRRFAGNGEKHLEREFIVPFDRQSYPQLVATDLAGNEVISANLWLYQYHAGIFRCGDNSNLLSQNPNIIYFPNWDCSLVPCVKYLATPNPGLSLGGDSEGAALGYSTPSKLPWQRILSENHVSLATPDGKAVDFPAQYQDASSRSRFSLMVPGVVAIIDQAIGEQAQERSYCQDRAPYAHCSIQKRAGDNPWYRRKHRVYQTIDRLDTWWNAVYHQIVPQYEGGYTVVEGEIEFLRDVQLREGLKLATGTAGNPGGPVELLTSAAAVENTKAESFNKLGDSGFAALVSDPTAYYAFFPLRGTDPLSYTVSGDNQRMVLDLRLGEKGQNLKAGMKLTYRFAVGSFIKDPQHGDYLKRFAALVNDGDYPVAMKQGTLVDRSGFLSLKAEQGAARLALGPQPFIQNLPIRVAGLEDNGTAMAYSSLDKTFKPLGFNGGLAYAAAPMERTNELWLGDVFIASEPAVRMTLVPKMVGLPEGFLEVHNPTDHAIKVNVASPAGTPIYGGVTFELDLPAGASVRKTLRGYLERLEAGIQPRSPAASMRSQMPTFSSGTTGVPGLRVKSATDVCEGAKRTSMRWASVCVLGVFRPLSV